MVEKLSAETFYAEGGRSGKLLGLRCEKGHVTVPPRHSCRICQSLALSVVELSCQGQILEYTQVYSKSKDFPLEAPYLLALARLDEGPNLLGIVEGSKIPEDNARVRVAFRTLKGHETERPRIFFELP
ncbi:MAG: Zn-ribbon domain-containing OB-fold protein [Nitrososphaerales archaeon]